MGKLGQYCIFNHASTPTVSLRGLSLYFREQKETTNNIMASHWLVDSIFPAQFTVKNVVCFSVIFH
jgi:hypothetical protein